MKHTGLVLTWQPTPTAVWLAHSLDFDLMVEGSTEEAAIESLQWVVRTAADDDRKQNTDIFSRVCVSLPELYARLSAHKENGSLGLQRVTFEV